MKINLGVLYGGETVEHEVSIISALQAIQNLNKEKYNVIPIYIGKDRTIARMAINTLNELIVIIFAYCV